MTTSRSTQPIHGNYHGYYTKRPSVYDPRLEMLPDNMLQNARVLDVGCNEGWVTCEIGQLKGAKKVVGVDIDDTLIRAAWKRRRYVWSLQEPPHDEAVEDSSLTSEPSIPSKRKAPEDAPPRSDANQRLRANYFPASCEHMFGPFPIPSTNNGASKENDSFPHNVVFRTADWVATEIPEDAEGYDVVIAFSISKWIHLNGGDEALLRFFRRVHSVLRTGGTFVLEPQEWDTYAKARRMDQKLKEIGSNLKIHPEKFEAVLKEIGFVSAQHLGRIGDGGFRRPIDLYIKRY